MGKKYKIIYAIIYSVLILLIVTKGIRMGIEIRSHYDGMFGGSSRILICNLIIAILTIIITVIITLSKKNEIKRKKVLMIGSILLALAVPVGNSIGWGGPFEPSSTDWPLILIGIFISLNMARG